MALNIDIILIPYLSKELHFYVGLNVTQRISDWEAKFKIKLVFKINDPINTGKKRNSFG